MAARIARPARLYTTLARAEMVTWALLLLGMLLKYAAGMAWATRVFGGVHGFVFLSYALVTVVVAIDHRWPLARLAAGLGSAVLPFATVPFERWAEREGLLDGDWRLLHDDGQGPLDRVVAWGLRNAALAAVLALVLVAVVFGLLLLAGPPTRWFG